MKGLISIPYKMIRDQNINSSIYYQVVVGNFEEYFKKYDGKTSKLSVVTGLCDSFIINQQIGI